MIHSLLSPEGLNLAEYARRFGTEATVDLPGLAELGPLGLAERSGDELRLTAEGLERSDAIGPWLDSAKVRSLKEGYAWR